ncbi:APC family permease [Brevibacillus centrosporus]|uniref:APC family permease n=1 Tax=Brevibacillus centrosporus TaxID=54910 RepID=UPI002E249E78|nr:APC family permease [Brevibacillus centrosporus]
MENTAATEIVGAQSEAGHTAESFGYKQELHRGLTLKDLIIYGLITMLPIAPIEVYGLVAQASMGMVPFVYMIGIVAMVFTALSYNTMSKEFPISGSVYSYVQRGLNPHVGFVTGWLIMIDYIMCPALLTGFSALWLNPIIPSVPNYLIILVFTIINTAIIARGITLTAIANRIFLVMELVILALFIILAVKYVLIDGHGAGGFSMAPLFQADKIDLGFLATATSIAVLGFLGFDVISTLSEEVKNPVKTVGRATVSSLLIIGLLFIAQTYVAALAHPDYENLDSDMAMFDIAREIGGDWLYYTFIIVGVLAVGIANALAIQSAISRIIYSMSRDKLLPFSGVLGKIHPRYKTPFNATVFVGLVTLVVGVTVSIESIVQLLNFGALTSFLLLNITVFVYFLVKKRKRGLRAYLKYGLLPALGFSIIAFVWSGFDSRTFMVGFVWMFIGIILGAIKSKGYREVPPTLKDV